MLTVIKSSFAKEISSFAQQNGDLICYSIKTNEHRPMNIEELRDYCLTLKGVTEHFPFDEYSLVFKVQGKMFGLIPLENPEAQIALKCNPERAIQLREDYPEAITNAWHFNSKHWNTVRIHPSVTRSLLLELVDHSYDLVVKGLTRKQREELQNL